MSTDLPALREAVAWRMPHDTCDDCWYSCPMSGECCDESQPKDRCTCYASIVNKRLDTISAALAALLDELEQLRASEKQAWQAVKEQG